ncbi:hypothetical protein ACFCP7_28315 [Paenibacillus elgii]
MKKKLASTVAAIALVCSISASSVFANDVVIPPPSDKGGVITPFETRKVINNENIANNTQHTMNFDIPAGFGMVKVYVHNTGKASINVVVTDSSGSVKMSGKADAHGGVFDQKGSSAWGTGKHSVSLTSVEDMSGTVSVKLAETSNEL